MLATDFITKILPPTPRPDLVARRRLLNLLHSAALRKVTIVQAPAGYGKTSLLAQFTHDTDMPVSWVSLDRSDQDPMKLLQDIASSISHWFPYIKQNSPAAMGEDAFKGNGWRDRLASILNEVHNQIPEIFVLVLDDFHVVEENPEIIELADALLTPLPENLRLFLVSRHRPQVPALPRLRALREVSRVTEEHLRFSKTEIREFFSSIYHRELDESQSSDLIEKTAGWISAIILFAENMNADRPLEITPDAEDDLFQYLANEVFTHQPDELKSFLLSVSVLDELEPDICDEVTGYSNSRLWLSHLRRHDLLVSYTADPNPVFRLHNLFRDFLMDTLAKENPAALETLHQSAGEAYERRGRIPEAIDHYLSAKAFEKAARLLEEVSRSLLHHGNWHSLKRWIEALPRHLVDEHPLLLVCQSWIATAIGNPGSALEISDRAQERFQSLEDIEGITRALFVKSVAFRYKGLFNEAIDVSRKALRNAVHNDAIGNASLKAGALKHLGLSFFQKGEFDAALEPLKEALRSFELSGETHSAAEMHNVLGLIYGQWAKYPEALSHFERARQYYGKVDNPKSLAEVFNNIGMLCYVQGDFDYAQETLLQSIRIARDCHNLRPEAYALATLADVKRDAGDVAGSLEFYQEALEKAYRAELASLIPYLLDAMATAYRLVGQLDKAESLVRQSLSESTRLSDLEEGLYKRSLGAILSEKGDYKGAAPLLEKAATILSQANVPQELAKTEFFLANLSFSAGDIQNCGIHLIMLADLLQKLRHDTFLVAEVRGKADLIEHALSQGIGEKCFYPLLQKARSTRLLEARVASEEAAVSSNKIDCYSLGAIRAVFNGREVPRKAWEGKTALLTLLYFINNSKELRKEEVIEAIWPDCSPEKGNSSFQSALYRIRRALYRDAIIERQGMYMLNSNDQWRLDAREFERLVQTAGTNGLPRETVYSLLEEAVELYKGEFLADFDAEWIDLARREIQNAYMSILGQLCRHYMDAHEYEKAIRSGRLILDQDPCNEESVNSLIEAYGRLGNREAAIMSYRKYASRIQDELGETPSQQVSSRYQAVLKGR